MWYTIKSTDKSEWLSSLAATYLGDWQKYPEIYAANQDVMVKGPDHVEPGMTLWIPVGGKPRPSNSMIETTTSINRAPATSSARKFDMNKILIVGGGALAAIAILMAMRK